MPKNPKKTPHFKKIVFSCVEGYTRVQYNITCTKCTCSIPRLFTWSIDDCGALKNHMIFKINSCFYFDFNFIKISSLSVLP